MDAFLTREKYRKHTDSLKTYFLVEAWTFSLPLCTDSLMWLVDWSSGATLLNAVGYIFALAATKTAPTVDNLENVVHSACAVFPYHEEKVLVRLSWASKPMVSRNGSV